VEVVIIMHQRWGTHSFNINEQSPKLYMFTLGPQVETSRNQAHAPLLVERFPKTRTQSEASQFGRFHNYKTNFFPSWINRCRGEAQNNSISQILVSMSELSSKLPCL